MEEKRVFIRLKANKDHWLHEQRQCPLTAMILRLELTTSLDGTVQYRDFTCQEFIELLHKKTVGPRPQWDYAEGRQAILEDTLKDPPEMAVE